MVDYGNSSVSSGGTLDVDANSSCSEPTSSPAENIIWSTDAPSGSYVVTVNLYSSCEAGDSHPFELTALVGGVPVQLYQGTPGGSLTPSGGSGVVSSGAPTVTFVFEVGGVS